MTVSEKSRWLILIVLSSALFLIVIDMTVLYTALPSLARDLGTSASEKLWIINAYALVVAGLLPGLGTLGDRVGHKRMFIAGLCVFGIASLVAAYSPSSMILIGARALLAVGAAMMMPATLSIIRLTFNDDRERALAIGIWSAVASGGAAVGPLVGGVLLEYFWWGSVFLINVPVVVVALAAASVFIPRRKGSRDVGWDPVGSLQILVGLVGLAYAIEELAKEAPSFLAAAAAAVTGALALAIFVRRQRRSAAPMFDLTLFENREFALGVVVALVSSFSVVGLELVLSQRLQLVLGYSPLQAALFVLPGSLLAFIGGPLAGWSAPRYGMGRGSAPLGRPSSGGPVPCRQRRPHAAARQPVDLRPWIGGLDRGGLERDHEQGPGGASGHGRLGRGGGVRARRRYRHHHTRQPLGRRVCRGPGAAVRAAAVGAGRNRPGVAGGRDPASRHRPSIDRGRVRRLRRRLPERPRARRRPSPRRRRHGVARADGAPGAGVGGGERCVKDVAMPRASKASASIRCALRPPLRG
jgi:MFS family permease